MVGERPPKSSGPYPQIALRERSWRLRIAIALSVLGVFAILASVGYYLLEPAYSVLDSLYMTVITIATVGYQEVHPLSARGQAWTIFVILGGVVTATVALSLIVGMVVEGQIRGIFGRRQLERKIASLVGHTIVCGYGRMGMLVTGKLIAAGREVVIVDTDPQRTALGEQAGALYVLGDAEEETVLEAAGIARARTLIASLATDAANVFVTLSAKQMNPGLRIIAMAREPTTQDKLFRAGATRVVCPHTVGASHMAEMVLRPAVVDFFDMAQRGVELEMDQLELAESCPLIGKTLRELSLPQRISAHVVAVRRADGQTSYHPKPDMALAAGDVVVLIGPKGVAKSVQKLQDQATAG